MDLPQTLAELISQSHRRLGRRILVGLAGPQGSGKSTLAKALPDLLAKLSLRTAVLALDDFYLAHAERQSLATRVHPLLATRGPPGAHEISLIEHVVDRLLAGETAAVPRFDKATDDRTATSVVSGPVDVVLLEGWCVGAIPQPDADLAAPVNSLERELDPDGVWRRFANDALGAYQPLFSRTDLLIQLRAPSFDTVAGWRWEQEAKLRDERGDDPASRIMTRDEVERFIQHYERITRWMFAEMPSRADVVVDLDADRQVVEITLSS